MFMFMFSPLRGLRPRLQRQSIETLSPAEDRNKLMPLRGDHA
jgi:hypothetical protein